MKRSVFHILFLTYFSVGCSISYQVGGSSGQLSYEQARARLIGEDAKVLLASGVERTGTVSDLTTDSLMLQASDTARPYPISLSSIESIVTSNLGSDIIGGGAIGCCGGGLAGCLIGVAVQPKGNVDLEKAGNAGIAGGAVGCLAGSAIGAWRENTYKFTQAQSDSVAHEKP